MVAKGQVAFRHHYGLWYDRRRIDHQMVRRPDANVYPPFFEQPFARSGVGTAWDGLSRYDLTRYNPWYFGRLNTFAEITRASADSSSSTRCTFSTTSSSTGAHWVDSPWRPGRTPGRTQALSNRPLSKAIRSRWRRRPSVDHPVRREVHRNYIRHCLDALADQPNVLHTLTAENSGPLSFMQFWLDVDRRVEGRDGTARSGGPERPKDVQDGIAWPIQCGRRWSTSSISPIGSARIGVSCLRRRAALGSRRASMRDCGREAGPARLRWRRRCVSCAAGFRPRR